LSPSLGRLDGYRRALEKHGIEWRPDYERMVEDVGDATDDPAYATMKELLALREPPDGVFCFNDPSALSAMKALLDAGLRIPEDVAFVGSGNIRHADFLKVPLTTIDQNSIAIGERAGKLALGLIESKTPQKARTALLEPRLVMRSSSMRIPG
jgi:LacI family transcriptional regulator